MATGVKHPSGVFALAAKPCSCGFPPPSAPSVPAAHVILLLSPETHEERMDHGSDG